MKNICIIDKIMRGTIIFWLTKIFLLAGSTWSAWESETDGCRRTTMLVMRTSSIRWKLDSKKASNVKITFYNYQVGLMDEQDHDYCLAQEQTTQDLIDAGNL